MKRSLLVAVILATAIGMPALAGTPGAQAPVSVFESNSDPVSQGQIDELVLGRLRQLGITSARVCSDGVFLRRVYLDVIGTLPTVDEASEFLKDTAADKRRKLIDRLLEREEFSDYWAMKWCDLLWVKSEFPVPAISGGRIFIRSGSSLFCIRKGAGTSTENGR